MAILLLADHDQTTLSSHTAKALTAARQIGGEIHVLVAGSGCAGVAQQAAGLEGVSRVFLADAPPYAHGLPEPLALLIAALAPGHDTLMAAATSVGKAVMPRVAAMLDVMQVSEIVTVLAPDTFERQIHAGSAVQAIRSDDPIRVVTVRTSRFAATGAGEAAPVEVVAGQGDPGLSRHTGASAVEKGRPELTTARVIVAGGRGLGSAQNFAGLIEPIAARLGGAIGASRAAVDAGYAPNDWQVGQSGKSVAPEIYIAVGISGAIQHLAGIKDAKTIVAINSDDQAPILQASDYYILGDLFEILPEIAEALSR